MSAGPVTGKSYVGGIAGSGNSHSQAVLIAVCNCLFAFAAALSESGCRISPEWIAQAFHVQLASQEK